MRSLATSNQELRTSRVSDFSQNAIPMTSPLTYLHQVHIQEVWQQAARNWECLLFQISVRMQYLWIVISLTCIKFTFKPICPILLQLKVVNKKVPQIYAEIRNSL